MRRHKGPPCGNRPPEARMTENRGRPLVFCMEQGISPDCRKEFVNGTEKPAESAGFSVPLEHF